MNNLVTRILRRISILVFVTLFLMTSISCVQKPLEEYYQYKGAKYAIQGRFKEAKKEFEKAFMLSPLMHEGTKLRIIGDTVEQKIERETAIHIFRGIDYLFKKKWDNAIAEINKAISENPNYSELYYLRSELYENKGLDEQAITDCNKAIEINPNFAEAYTVRAILYENKHQYDEAIADFNKAIALDATNAEAYYMRGYFHAFYGGKNQEKQDLAISDFNKAIALNPRYIYAYVYRGIVYADKGLYEQALFDYNKAIELNPAYTATAYWNKAVACENLGRIRETIEAYKNLIKYSILTKGILNTFSHPVINVAREEIRRLEKYQQ